MNTTDPTATSSIDLQRDAFGVEQVVDDNGFDQKTGGSSIVVHPGK